MLLRVSHRNQAPGKALAASPSHRLAPLTEQWPPPLEGLRALLNMSSATALRFFARQAGRLASSHMSSTGFAQCRATSGPAALRRTSTGPLLCNALGGRPALAPSQRQQQRRVAAAAGAATAQSQQAAAPAPTSAQRQELPKNFDPAASEEALYDWWEASGYFKPAEDAAGEPYTLSMPPPNVTGKLHMGHAMFATLQVGARSAGVCLGLGLAGAGRGPPGARAPACCSPALALRRGHAGRGSSSELAPGLTRLRCSSLYARRPHHRYHPQDIMARYQRMRGRPTLWLPGTGAPPPLCASCASVPAVLLCAHAACLALATTATACWNSCWNNLPLPLPLRLHPRRPRGYRHPNGCGEAAGGAGQGPAQHGPRGI